MELVHNLLLKKAKAANYSALELEQIQKLQEEVFIQYFLDRETNQILEKTTISEEELKKVYEENKGRYQIEETVKIDTIFLRDIEKAKEVCAEVNVQNFKKLKKKYDEKEKEEEENKTEWLGLSRLLPELRERIAEMEISEISKTVVEVEGGAHIVCLIDRQAPRESTYEEAKEILLSELRQVAFQNIQKQLVENMMFESKTLEEKGKEKTEEETKK